MENTIDELLTKLNACDEARDWAKGKTFEEIYKTCERGSWLCWLFVRTNPKDLRILTLVKGHQANTVRHLMEDERSLKAIDTTIAFGEGKATEEELQKAAHDAYVAYVNTIGVAWNYYTAATAAGNSAAGATSWAADAAEGAAWAAATRGTDSGSYNIEIERQNNQLTADIFRKYISIDKFKI